MAYYSGAKRDRHSFVQAGYHEEDELYIEKQRAGSAHDRLVDKNKRAYAEGGVPELSEYGVLDERPSLHKQPKVDRSFSARFREEVRKDKAGAALCAVLAVFVIITGFVWAGRLRESSLNRKAIARYNEMTTALIQENGRLQNRLEELTSADHIHSLAQRYGMLRQGVERPIEIYVQLPETTNSAKSGAVQEPKMELLDIMLGLMDKFHIGG